MIVNEMHPWITLVITVTLFLTLMFGKKVPLDFLFLGGLMLVTFLGIITPEQAFSGFSNPAVLTIGALLALASGLRKCGVIDWFGEKILGSAKSEKSAMARLALAILTASAFLLNTALVAMSVPMVLDWCRKRNISPSKLLIPVSYLAILGGVCTLIGTSTTLVVQAQLTQQYTLKKERLVKLETDIREASVRDTLATANNSDSNAKEQNLQDEISQLRKSLEDLKPMGFLEIGSVGFPCAIVGSIFLLVIGVKSLPDRRELIQQLGDQRREYLVEMMVQSNCRLVGKTVEAAGLRNLPGLFLIEIDRGEDIITPVSPAETIAAADRLIFTGVVETIIDLEQIPGLVPAADRAYELQPNKRQQRHLTEAVLSRSSPLIGQTIREANFRKLYSAAVVAVHRNGARLPSKIGSIRLQPGDTLLLQTRNRFVEMFRNSRDFFLISNVEGSEPRQHHKALWAGLIVVGMVLWMALGSLLGAGDSWANPPVAAFVAVMFMAASRCIRFSEARNSVDIQLLLTIACALGMGEAMQESGAAELLATTITEWISSPILLLITVYVLTMIMTEMVSNNAIAAIMIPIAISIAISSGSNPRPFILAIALAASLAFVTPIGYQTNLMVMGPGGYRPVDFVKTGLPLSLVVATTALLLLSRQL